MSAVSQTDAMFRWHQQNQEAQANAKTGGGGPVMFSLNPFLRDPATGAMPSAMQPTQGGIPPVLFGGFRAKGGPVRPGRAYVVGERGPELMVPSTPGTIVPNSALNPVNGRPSTFDGQSRTMFFGKAMQDDPSRGRAVGDGSGVYGDIMREAVGQAPRVDPRSFGTGGSRFVGPPAPAGSMPQTMPGQGAPMPPMQPSTGMLVAGPGGSTKWQPGTGPGTTLPPMTAPNQMPARPPVPAGSMPQTMPTMAASPMPFNNGSRIAQAPQNRPYGELVGSTGSLANRGVRPIGRSANDPMRIAEQMRRRGDPSALLRFGMQQMGQDFAREQNAVNFEQSQAMFGQQQQAINQRDAANFEQGQIMFGEQQNAMNQRDERNFEQQQQLEAERRAAELAAQNEARNRQPNVSFQPIPGTDYGIPSADGRPMGTLPVNKPKSTSYVPVAGVPGLMVPTGPGAGKLPPMQQTPNPGWSVTGQPKTRMDPMGGATPKAPSGIQYTYDADGNVTGGFYPRFNPATGRFVISKLDMDGDGVPDAQQGGAGAGAAKVPAWKSLMQ